MPVGGKQVSLLVHHCPKQTLISDPGTILDSWLSSVEYLTF